MVSGYLRNEYNKNEVDCVVDTGSSLSIISKYLVKKFKLKTEKCLPLKAVQTNGLVQFYEKCVFNLKIGNIERNILCYVVNNNLSYIILGLHECSLFNFLIDCNKCVVYQNNKIINRKKSLQDNTTLHIIDNIENNSGISMCVNNDNNFSKCFLSNNSNNDGNIAFNIPNNSIRCNNFTNSTMSYQHQRPVTTENINEKSQFVSTGNSHVDNLIQKYSNIFSKNKYDVGLINIEPQRIKLTSDLPICIRPYRTSPAEEAEIQSQIEQLLKAGFIQPSNSPYSAPVTLAYKKGENKKTRLCIDFRKLNAIAKSDAEPLPLIDGVLDKLSQAKIFSTLDLTSGYWHIPIHPQDTEKLAFSVQAGGLYEWIRLPFGYKNAPANFNRILRRILNKHKIKFACHYFDDIIIFSKSEEEHLHHLQQIFEVCKQENIKLNFPKCKFAQTKINFLGYEIENGQITPNDANIECIKKLKPPKNIKELQRVLGSFNVYHKHIDNYAKLRYPLNKLLRKDTPWSWTEQCQKSFEALKEKITSKPVLKLFDPKLPCHLFVDASTIGVGAVLKQESEDGTLHPIAYHSRTLRSYESNYAITELECLAIVDALDKFYHYLHGNKFTIHTDHQALVWLKNVKNLRGRLFRWSLKLSMFDYDIKYKKGTTNVEADMLSRHPVSQYIQHSVHLLDLDELKQSQFEDNLQDNRYKQINDIIVIKKKNFHKIVVPISLRLKVLQTAHHKFGHPGVKKMISLISPQYYWPNITIDISNYVKHCEICQLNKKSNQKKFGLMQMVPPTDKPFEIISVDTVGGFNYYNSTKKYLHIIIDHATRYVWAFPSKSVTSETYANILKQLFNIQIPEKILTDRNAAFTSSKFKKFLRNSNIKHLLTSAHHPQTNGKVERVNSSIVTRLKCKVNSSSKKIPWTTLLNEVINEYNNTPHSVTQFTPAYLLFGTVPYDPLISQNQYYPPVDEARKLAKQRTIEYHHKNKIVYDARVIPAKFKEGDLVKYEEFGYPNTRKLSSPYSGPYTIIKKYSDVNYEIDRPNLHTGQNSEIVHASRLRPYYPPENFKLNHEK